jgi:threonine/homoserine/homoserine lactone efflux protein
LSYIKKVTEGPDFYLYLGVIGGLLVLIIGIATLFSKSPEMKDPDHPSGQDLPARYSQLWLKGFLVNTLNPFAFFFWLSAASIGSVQGGGTGVYNAWIYLAGVFSMIIATDVLKVAGAKKIRYLLSKEKMDKVRLFIAVLLIISGVVLLVRTWMHFYK